MELKEILNNVDFKILKGKENIEIENIQYDSRKIEKGDLFFAIQGYSTDGHKFIKKAYDNGAVAIICDKDLEFIPDCTVIRVEDSRKAMAMCSSNFYGNPKEKLKIIGITGTNGKTTSSFMVKSILEKAGYKVAILGTIANYIGKEKLHSDRTTPESLEIHKLFKTMVEKGVKYCVMEVSSHSLYLDRVYGIQFSEGVFTNLTQDHLDFHKTFENYYNSKLILFKNSKNSIINIDDEYGRRLENDILNNVITYSIEKESDFRVYKLYTSAKGVSFSLDYLGKCYEFNVNIPGKYNIMNAVGSIVACLNEGIPIDKIKDGLEGMSGVKGRCELVTKSNNLGYEVIVDYAHTPDGLENILKTAKEFTKGRLIGVFGCGGDRDKTKRPIMGKIGTKLSDIAVITSDNPRTEEPMEIINDIKQGIQTNNYMIIENRREAIKKAMKMAKRNDVIVVAGKGHEDYQILKDKTIHFDEREIIQEIIKELY